MVTCLLEAKVANITHDLNWLVESAGEETTVMVHAGTNNVGKCSHVVLAGRNLDSYTEKARTYKGAFSEVLPVLHAGPAGQAQIRSLNAWVR